MKDEDFIELVTSIQEAGDIKRGTRKPSRVFEIRPVDIKAAEAAAHAVRVRADDRS